MEHSKLPWHIDTDHCGTFICSGGLDVGFIDENDAQFIVRAVNSHYELVEACEDALRQLTYCNAPPISIKNLKASLKKAKGE